jgi:hypothetical protein
LKQVEAHPSRRYYIFKNIILNNLFGVDIMEEAVEICKLRLFLKLVAQVEPDPNKDNFGIEPLPDIDFNIRAGNTLVGYATAEEVRKVFKENPCGKQVQYKLMLRETQSEFDRFEEQVELADRAFKQFHRMQTEPNLDSKDFAGSKQTLRERLKILNDELNRHLAREYGVKLPSPSGRGIKGEGDAYDKWLKSHQPFHWFVEFYGIMQSGGFDVIIGNPPYVEYKKIKNEYQIRSYKTLECGNLYAYIWERSVKLGNSRGLIGLIIPVSSVCTDGYEALRKVWLSSGDLLISNFNDRPGKLFDGLEHIRLAIVLLSKSREKSIRTFTTTYWKWLTEIRNQLFDSLRFSESTKFIRNSSIPKIGSEVEKSILTKLDASRKTLNHFSSNTGNFQIFYTRKLSWFVQILDFAPRINDAEGRKREPSELKYVSVKSKLELDAFLSTLNSSLFYWFLSVWSDCRNLNKREVLGVPFDFTDARSEELKDLGKLATQLMDNLKNTSKALEMNYKNWGKMKIQCIYPKLSKPIIDQIDQVLAKHYGFTDEELDFIINYDIKYRMGRVADASEEDE